LIGLPLVAHLTIHWAYTNVGDDPDGKRFAKVREGVGKWLLRRGIEFAAVWCIERMARDCSSWTETCQPFAFAFDAIASRLVQASELRSSSFRHPVPRSQTHALAGCSLHHKASMKRPQDTLIGSSNFSHPLDQLPAWKKSSA
jgi:hypothetical protein